MMLFSGAVAIAVLVLAPALQSVQATDPRTQPETAVKEAVRLLDAGKYAEFLKTFARPSEVEELTAKRTMEEVAAEFGQKRAPDLLAALRAAGTMKPALSAEGTRAEYAFEKPFGRERRVSMVKIGEFWYFR